MQHRLRKVDCILALGSHDTRVAERAAELYLREYAPLLLFSGGLGRVTAERWDIPEAQVFATIAERMGVPSTAMLIEDQSTSTGENCEFSKSLLAQRGIAVRSCSIVQKPYMERRAYATFKKRWPEVEIVVTSPQLSFEE